MSLPVLEKRPHSILYAEDGSIQTKHVVQGRKYEVLFSDGDVHLFRKYWACYQLRQPENAPVPPVSVCKMMPFFKIEEALKYVEDERDHRALDFNDTNPHKGVIYTSAIEIAKARFAGKITF